MSRLTYALDCIIHTRIYVYAYVYCAFICLSIYVSTSASCSLTYSNAPTAPSTLGSLQLSNICIYVYIHNIMFYVYECFTYNYVHVTCVCLMPKRVIKSHWSP